MSDICTMCSTKDEQVRKLRECLEWALEWIDAVPSGTVLPTMPGFDRDYVNNILDETDRQGCLADGRGNSTSIGGVTMEHVAGTTMSATQCKKINKELFGYDYPFGKGVTLHSIGDIRILEYIEITDGQCLTDRHLFHVVGSHVSDVSLDKALVTALSLKYDQGATRAVQYICRILNGMETPTDSWEQSMVIGQKG